MTRTLKEKARKGQVNPEDLFRLAKNPSPEKARLLNSLAEQYAWEHHPCFPKAPMATWAEIVAAYCENGLDGVAVLAENRIKRPLVFRFIQEIPSEETLKAFLKMVEPEFASPQKDPEMSMKVAGTLNSLGFTIKSQKIDMVRTFLHELLTSREPTMMLEQLCVHFAGTGTKSRLL